ncbi:MAG: beta-galactosidase trimerization domain-containing protein [Planctomycetota bacterium]|nr:beta-galactosidase trimerization domain-containing protein [Planctomycetota bacterium]
MIRLSAILLSCTFIYAEDQAQLQVRMRVTELKPSQPARILWRWGGEGLGGRPVRGELTQYLPDKPDIPDAAEVKADDLDTGALEIEEKPKDRITVQDDTWMYDYLNPGIWSTPHPLTAFKRNKGRLFLTVTLNGHKTATAITDAELEVELLRGKESLKRFTVAGSDGPTFGVVLPYFRLQAGKATPEFISDFGSLHDYVNKKIAHIESMPWSNEPVPKLYGIVTDCSGYKAGSGYGCRTADKATMLAEFRVLRMLGINGTRGCASFVLDLIRDGEGIGKALNRARITSTTGYPINKVKYADGKPPLRRPGDGCPFHPVNIEGIPGRVKTAVDALLANARTLPVHEVWALTDDEIGTVFGGAPEKKSHMGCCPYCRRGFQNFVKTEGRTLKDFGAPDWKDIRATYGYWAISFWETKRKYEADVAAASKALKAETEGALDANVNNLNAEIDEDADDLDAEIEGKPKRDYAKELMDAEARLKHLIWSSSVMQVPKEERKHRLSDEGWKLLSYYSRRFNAETAAGLFQQLQERIADENARKQKAIESSEDSVTAHQPWIYSYALRGNTFLMGGHSLGFFDFYHYADNGFVYETSNRDRRVWQWDSYLCDVGRSLSRFRAKRFGIYVKPHRGAPVQRALTAIARGARLLYWYTYGPDWSKGDTFGGRFSTLEKIGWVSRVIARAEEVTYESDWAQQAEVAIVRPRTAEFFSGSASWENGKWVYTALMHSHIPVAPLDEVLLLEQDLSLYKVIVICGDHIRRGVAAKLKEWVNEGGTLFTMGRGMKADESDSALEDLHPLLGIAKRVETQTWASVPRYGATSLRAIRPNGQPPEGAKIQPSDRLKCEFVPAVGREVVDAAEGAEIVLKYEDGRPALIKNRYGKGAAWFATFYAGLEYANDTMQRKPFDGTKRACVSMPLLSADVRPVVDADEPLVEGVLLKNRKSGKQAVVLINWKFKIEEPLRIRVRGARKISQAYSCALKKELKIQSDGEFSELTVPHMAEGDIVLLQ